MCHCQPCFLYYIVSLIRWIRFWCNQAIQRNRDLKEIWTYIAHPLLLSFTVSPWIKNLILSWYTETEEEALRKGIVGLMEIYKGYVWRAWFTGVFSLRCTKQPKRLTALGSKVTGPTLSSKLEKFLAESPPPRWDNPLSLWPVNGSYFKVVSYTIIRQHYFFRKSFIKSRFNCH